MIVATSKYVRVRVAQEGVRVRITGPGVKVYVTKGMPGAKGDKGDPGDAGTRYDTLEGTSIAYDAGTVVEFVTIAPHTSERTVLIGTTPGGSQLASETIAANTKGMIRLFEELTSDTTLHFTGSPLSAKIYRSLP